jgi:pimeloyl-ACP methyl ester carboxylesterase
VKLRTIDIDLQSVNIRCDETGVGERPFILLHGLTGHRKDFDRVLPALATHGRTLAPDLRGHGDSSHPGTGRGYDFETLVQDMVRFLDRLAIQRCDLLGHSFGGMLALRFALAHPERVASLILMSTSCEAPDILSRDVFVKAGGFAESKGMVELQARLEELGLAEETPPSGDATADQREWQGRYWAHHKLRLCAMDPYAYGGLGLAMMDQDSQCGRLSEIGCPTTVIIGTDDAEFVRGAGMLSAGLKEGVRHDLQGVGHHPQRESREKFLSIVGEHLARARGSAAGKV